ncbi:TonB family protein [Psychrobacter sp. CAL346-MNA-CIBAN-0220]|uniref:energy transducer TonB family protein n=1 Tax=Psychrobacter sp. CAL346-MNA-CIBAN-0220 TaxID=3140457 RepID=UPI0033256389
MNNAPAVYVPTQPEGDGLTLPTLLSLLAHGIVIGLLIYNYQSTKIENAGSIETIMVSPEQLAEMQGQILANRAAASASLQADSTASGAMSSEPLNPNNTSISTPNSSGSTSQRMPVFLPSDISADTYSDESMLMSQEQQQRFIEKSQEYERNIDEWSTQQDDMTLEKLERVEDNKKSKLDERREQLKDFRAKKNNPPKIEKPNSSQRNIEINSGNAGKNYSLSDGQSTLSGDTSTSSSSKGSSRSASSNSGGASNSEIINLVKRNYNPPIGAKGSTQRATLTITINANGDVVNVSVSGSDSAVNDAAKQAVLNTRNLPIDADDPKYPTFTIQFNGSN